MDKAALQHDLRDFARRYLGHGPAAIVDLQAHLDAVDRWAAELEGVFPPPEFWRACATWSLPADQRLLDPATTSRDIQRRCAQALLDGANHIRKARPAQRAQQRVAAMILYPDMFTSQVQVFLDPAYYRRFEQRSGQQVWTRLPVTRSLVGELGLVVPKGFVERGWLNTVLDEAGEAIFYQCEIWMIGEPVD